MAKNREAAPEWARKAIFYQIFPERFCNGDSTNDPVGTVPWDSAPTRENFLGGDIAGIRSKLEYLQHLGITALYLTPFFKAQSNHRYDTSDYLQIDPAVGTLEDFHGLIADLKQRNIRLLLDAVFNHCGDNFWAFQDVCQNREASAYKDWFFIDSYPVTMNPPSYQTCGGAPFLPKLNLQNSATRDYLLHVTRYWLEHGIDGWRLDVPWKVPLDFWRDFQKVVVETNPEAYILAELWRGTQPWLDGDTVDGVMNYRLRNAILDFCAFDHMDAEDFDYEIGELRREHGPTVHYHQTLLSSHDTARFLTLCQGDVGRMTTAIVFQMTYLGIPSIYYGDEIGMMGENDPGCRGGMVWETDRWNNKLYLLYQKLIHLRRTNLALTDGDFEPLRTFNGLYAYHRFTEQDSIIVVLNPRHTLQKVQIPLSEVAGRISVWRDILSQQKFPSEAGRLIIERMPERSALVLVPTDMKDG